MYIYFCSLKILCYFYYLLIRNNNFIIHLKRLLMSSEELRLFDKVRVYLDEDFSSPEHFTVIKIINCKIKLGNLFAVFIINYYILFTL